MEQDKKENQSKQYYHLLFIFSVILISTFIIFYFFVSRKIDKSFVNNDVPAFEETPYQAVDTKYILKEYNGKIGIFENEALIYTLDTYVFTLPEYDKKLLNDGIEISTKEELYELLEEYY